MRALVTLLVAVIMVALGAISYASEDLLALTNADRSRHGLAPLTRTPDLQAYAQRRAEEMMRAAKLWHSSNLGVAVTNWRVVGENVGRGPSLSAIESAFMASPAHRVNILSPQFSQAGVGVVWDGVDEFFVGCGVKELRPSIGIQRIDRDDVFQMFKPDHAAVGVHGLQETFPDVSIILFGENDEHAGIEEIDKHFLV